MWQLSKYLSLNVAGLTNVIKRQRVCKFLQKENPARVCLQETRLKVREE